MKRFLKGGIITATIIAVAGVVIFYACNKDNEFNPTRDAKLMGSCQTPQIVPISTVIMVGTVEYPVVGTAVMRNYDGLIYECNVHWTMQVDGEDFTQVLNATLRPEYDGTTLYVEPVMDNYIITVTNPDMLTAVSIYMLWTKIVEICNANVTQNHHFVIMTDAERQYVIENGQSMTIDDFKLHAVEIITNKVGQFLVTTVENGNVYFMGISATGNQASWYNRFHEHFISHPPMVDPNEPRLVGCTAWTNITDQEGLDIYNEILKILFEMGLDIVYEAYTDGEGNIWIRACNGTCFC